MNMECPKCEREIKEKEKECPYCHYDLVNRPNELFTKFKDFIQKKSLIIESILSIIIIIMFATNIGTNGQKEKLKNQYNELQEKSESTTETLKSQIQEKNNKIIELQQDDKKNEINQSIKTLESEKQKLEEEKKALEGEKQNLTVQIEELKKTSSILTEKKNNKVSTSSANNTSSETTTPVTTTAQNTNSAIVYVTNTGKKYHKPNCSYLKKSKIQMNLSEAQSQGYTPCSKCY